tara:strand:+ start:3088 stop:4008 length:921 start_codon:yes stop_codon:yes gene_type:complete
MNNNFECILCKNNEKNDYYEKTRENDEHKIVICKKCNHIQLYPINFNAKEYYDHDKQDKNITNIGDRTTKDWEEMVNNQSLRRIKYLEQIIDDLLKNNDTINMCDIGGGYGHFCRNIKNKYGDKINITLLEPGCKRINKHNNENIIMIESLLDENFAKNNKETYDIVTCFHVFEHVFEPKKFIELLKSIVKKNGFFYIEVPNQNNELTKLSTEYNNIVWYMNCHVSYFTPEIFFNLIKSKTDKIIEFKGFERYGLLNFLYWVHYNKPQKGAVNYYNGESIHEIEDIWIQNRSDKLISDSIYAIIQK